MINIFDFIKDFAWNMKVSVFNNKHTPKDNRDAAFFYFESKAQKAIEKNNEILFNKVLSVFINRFSITISNSIKDFEEKDKIKDLLISYNQRSIEPLKDYIRKEYHIAYPISVLEVLIGEQETLNFLNSVLTTDDTLFDDKLVEKRVDILKYFEGRTMFELLDKVMVFLNDSDDRLVIAAIRFLRDYDFSKNLNIESISENIIKKFLDENTSVRIRLELINILVEHEWKVSGYKKRIEEVLPEGYYITSQGYVRFIDKAIKV